MTGVPDNVEALDGEAVGVEVATGATVVAGGAVIAGGAVVSVTGGVGVTVGVDAGGETVGVSVTGVFEGGFSCTGAAGDVTEFDSELKAPYPAESFFAFTANLYEVPYERF